MSDQLPYDQPTVERFAEVMADLQRENDQLKEEIVRLRINMHRVWHGLNFYEKEWAMRVLGDTLAKNDGIVHLTSRERAGGGE